MTGDRARERARYDRAAQVKAALLARDGGALASAESISAQFQPPYLRYHERVRQFAGPETTVLEIGAGNGVHTQVIADTGAQVIGLDISTESLRLCKSRTDAVALVCADMAALPFDDDSFEVVASAGSLSYGDPDTVNAEIFRVLRPGGALLVVDSLNHNPIYRINRWRHYRRGERTKSTLLRMPDLARIRSLTAPFASSSVEFFGSYLFMHPPLSRIVGSNRAARATNWLDVRLGPDRYAFKFVLIASDFRPGGSGKPPDRTTAKLPGEAPR